MTLYLVAATGLVCVVLGAFLIAPSVGLITLGSALLLVYLAFVNRPEGAP
jgi:hypothetical protein